MPSASASQIGQTLRRATTKVPEITAYFWITKILTTAMGETGSDFSNAHFGPEFAVPVMLVVLGFALKWQLNTDRYHAWPYWSVVAMISVFGTSAADALHELGVPFVATTILWAIGLAWILRSWHRSEMTLSIHSIHSRRREKFYWATVLATFALGTAAGDLTAVSLNLGFWQSGVMFTAMMLIPAFAYWKLKLNSIAAFWASYILTRPVGASFSDWAAVPKGIGGLGLGTGSVTLVLALIIVAVVAFLAKTKLDIQGEYGEVEEPRRQASSARREPAFGAELE